jgi:hypothetical protein
MFLLLRVAVVFHASWLWWFLLLLLLFHQHSKRSETKSRYGTYNKGKDFVSTMTLASPIRFCKLQGKTGGPS